MAMGSPTASCWTAPATSCFARGCPAAPTRSHPPVIFNPGRPARAITDHSRIGSQFAIAAADAHFDPYAIDRSIRVHRLDLYGQRQRHGLISHRIAFSTTALPTSLAAARLERKRARRLDRSPNALDDSVTVAFQSSPGQFAAP